MVGNRQALVLRLKILESCIYGGTHNLQDITLPFCLDNYTHVYIKVEDLLATIDRFISTPYIVIINIIVCTFFCSIGFGLLRCALRKSPTLA